MIGKKNRDYKSGYTKPVAKFFFAIARRLPWFLLRFMRWSTLKLFTLFASRKKLCTVAGAHGYPRESYSAEWFSGSESMLFEGREFPVPRGWRQLLENMYGDYMIPPPEEEKTGHFEKNGSTTPGGDKSDTE